MVALFGGFKHGFSLGGVFLECFSQLRGRKSARLSLALLGKAEYSGFCGRLIASWVLKVSSQGT